MVWQMSDLKQLFAYPGCDAGIRSMALSYDQRLEQSLVFTRFSENIRLRLNCISFFNSHFDFLWLTDPGDYIENSVLACFFLACHI